MATKFLCIGGPLDKVRATSEELAIRMPEYNSVYTSYNCSYRIRRPNKKMIENAKESGRPVLTSAIMVHNSVFQVKPM
jgi:hypothetical protein